jgi:uncharacterized membrane protein (DUF4010 family)
VRVGVLVALIAPDLVRTLAIPLGAMTVAALVGTAFTFRGAKGEHANIKLTNPFELSAAVKVSLMFGIVLLVTKAANTYLGAGGLYVASALGGTTDVDAVTLSTAKLVNGDLAADVATVSISIAIAANTIVKTGLAMWVGGAALGKRMVIIGALILVAGAAGLVPVLA